MTIIFFVVTILILEIALRIYIFSRSKKFFFLAPEIDKTNKRICYKPHPYVGYCKSEFVSNPKFPSNSHGFAGTKNYPKNKSKNSIRFVVCGGSTVEQNDYDRSDPFDPEITWPSIMEKKMNKLTKKKKIEVLNAGCAGYTIMENVINLFTKCIHWKPNCVILFATINDIWFIQTVSGFKEDFTHMRKEMTTIKKNYLDFFPNIRIFFLYQYSVRLVYKLLGIEVHNLFSAISKKGKWNPNFNPKKIVYQTYEKYLRLFCNICLENKIKPILIPMTYWQLPINNKLVTRLPFLQKWNKKKFLKIIEKNNHIIKKVSREIPNVELIELKKLDKDCFRKEDWTHFSKKGLYEIGNFLAKKLKNKTN